MSDQAHQVRRIQNAASKLDDWTYELEWLGEDATARLETIAGDLEDLLDECVLAEEPGE